MSYQISVLDKSPVAEGASPEQALRNSLQLAQRAEQLGYHRYWFAEHHAAPTLASPAPEVLAAWVLAQTRRIRIGSGGVMLRHYAPYKVAENFNLLAALAPGAWIWAWARPRRPAGLDCRAGSRASAVRRLRPATARPGGLSVRRRKRGAGAAGSAAGAGALPARRQPAERKAGGRTGLALRLRRALRW
jgi:hypothetical protein